MRLTLREWLLLLVVIGLASWQVTARSEDPNGVALYGTQSVLAGTASSEAQYRPLSHYVAYGLQLLSRAGSPPYAEIRFAQCVLIFGLAYALYAGLGLEHRTRLLGICLLAGLMSLSLGRLGPSTFSLDRFTDTIFYLVAALLVLRGHELWLPPLMILAVANRETSVFMPALIVARHGLSIVTDPRLRKPLFTAAAAWMLGAVVWFAIHTYYGPRQRLDPTYWGPDMMLASLAMPAQIAYFFAAVSLLPLLGVLSLRYADPFLRRLFWLVIPLWLGIHIWAARMGEGIQFLAPLATILVPLLLQGLERHSSALVQDRALEASNLLEGALRSVSRVAT